MDQAARLERALETAVDRVGSPGCPPRLAAALQHAVFPGGARIRPRLCLAVASACGGQDRRSAEAAAVAIELLHCASLVHDDLPCFDDADTRRGQPSVHRLYGEPLAVLAGDALIVLAFETLAREAAHAPARMAALLTTVARAAGAPHGICAGQAWESEPAAPLEIYQRAKTGALFVAATSAGAVAAGADPTAWRQLGEHLGEAYQIADDLNDAMASQAALGKPVRRDAALGRPSSARDRGIVASIDRLKALVSSAVGAVPECEGADELRQLVIAHAKRIMPPQIEQAGSGRGGDLHLEPSVSLA